MGRYDNEEMYGGNSGTPRQRDLVLSTNEFCFIQSKTNGQIKTYTGPTMVTISQQESMVVFNSKNKKFEETNDFEKARQLFTSAPEGWYAVLKNPTKDNSHPEAAKAMGSPDLQIGRKVNIAGPCSFSLFPGQMAKVVQGHRLRSNQYLLARVYDADAAEKSVATIVDADGKEVEQSKTKYFVGQLLVIKGTEVSFYMPPTGIEVIADGKNYVRDAVTLERLEYAILKDEDGEKTYHHGPAVVFPEPTETFVESPKGGVIFRALELSPISGIYLKVIADYTDDDGTVHKTGDELFITGKDQMIYYPRPEQALIQYDGKYMHHAIAIPEGEGRYILNRLNGEIKTVVGPAMYLPDPRKEVVVKRKLSAKECNLYYPGNVEALQYNAGLSEKGMERLANKGMLKCTTDDIVNSVYSTASSAIDSLAIFEANANISRGTSYTKPRTITLDTKFDGVVSIDVWSGYAICVVSKSGEREIVCGPQTRLLDYDETLEVIKTNEGETVFLPLRNNKVTDRFDIESSDFVKARIGLTYTVEFNGLTNTDWFSVYDYPTHINDVVRSEIKRAAKQFTIKELYANYHEMISGNLLNESEPFTFDNGAEIVDVEITEFLVDSRIDKTVSAYRDEIVKKTFELANAKAQEDLIKALAENRRMKLELENKNRMYELELENKLELDRFAKEEVIREKERIAKAADVQAKADLQQLMNAINEEEISREVAKKNATIEAQKKVDELAVAKQQAYAESVKSIMASVSPDLVAALSAKANADILTEGMRSMSPWALANNEEVSTTVDRLLRGTPLEGLLTSIKGDK